MASTQEKSNENQAACDENGQEVDPSNPEE